MEAVKAMIAILLAAAVEFAAMVFYNSKTEPAYGARIIQANKAGAAEIMKQAALAKTPRTPGAVAHQDNKNSKL